VDIKAVSLEEAKTIDEFLTKVSFATPGTIDAQYHIVFLMLSFRAKLRNAIEKEEAGGEEG